MNEERAATPPLLTRGFVSLLMTQATFGFGFSTFFLLPKYLATELAADASDIGNVMGIFGVSAVVMIPLVGVWVDRFERRRFMTAGTVLMAVSSLGFLWVDAVGPLVMGLRIVQGAAFSLMFIAAATLVTDHAPAERMGQAIGLFGVSMLTMNAIAPSIAEEIALNAGWAPVFWMASGVTALSCLLSRLVPERRTPPADRDEIPGLMTVFTRPGVPKTAVILVLTGTAFGAMFTFQQPFALELGMTHVRGFFVAYAAVALFVRVFLGGLADRTGRHRVSVLSLCLYAVVVLWMADLTPNKLAWIGAVFGLAHGFFFPAFNAVAISGAGEHERGKMMGIIQGSFNAGVSGGVVALGYLAEGAGYPAVFVAAAIGAFVGLLLLISRGGSPGRSHG